MTATQMLFPAAAAAALGALNLVQRRKLIQARRDPVTGLVTRAAWMQAAERAIRRRPGLLLVAVDGDGFKAVNDTFGHDAGDLVLAALGDRLAAWVGPRGVAGRLGGDEFMAFLRPGRTDSPLTVRMAELTTTLSAPVPFGAAQLPASASIGAVLVEQLPKRTLQQAMRGADVALYAAKAAGRGTWRLAEPPAAGYPVQPDPQVRLRDRAPHPARQMWSAR